MAINILKTIGLEDKIRKYAKEFLLESLSFEISVFYFKMRAEFI